MNGDVMRIARRAGAWRVAVLVVVALTVAAAVGLLTSRSANNPAAGVEHGDHHGIETTELPAEVDATLRTAGTVAALTQLDELVEAGKLSPTARHQLVHELGRRSFGYAGGDVAVAFGSCDSRFDSGCYHGVLQAFFTAQPQRALADLPRLCDGTVVAADAAPLLRFQCVHGLGHGLAIVSRGDPRTSLAQCDALTTAADRRDCHGGVFMEHVVSTAGRPGYSCDSIPGQYQEQCYLHASAVLLLRNGTDVPAAFAECDAFPRPYIHACYQGMGRDIAGTTRYDLARVAELCALGGASHRGWCTAGAATALVSKVGPGAALALCGVTPAGRRNVCFEHVGRMLHELHPRDMGLRARECIAAGPDGLEPCRRGAGVA